MTVTVFTWSFGASTLISVESFEGFELFFSAFVSADPGRLREYVDIGFNFISLAKFSPWRF